MSRWKTYVYFSFSEWRIGFFKMVKKTENDGKMTKIQKLDFQNGGNRQKIAEKSMLEEGPAEAHITWNCDEIFSLWGIVEFYRNCRMSTMCGQKTKLIAAVQSERAGARIVQILSRKIDVWKF